MFNKVRLKEAVAEYKKCFVQKWWLDEKYKWEMVKWQAMIVWSQY